MTRPLDRRARKATTIGALIVLISGCSSSTKSTTAAPTTAPAGATTVAAAAAPAAAAATTAAPAAASSAPAANGSPLAKNCNAGGTFKIGFAQANNAEPYRQAVNADLLAAAKKYPSMMRWVPRNGPGVVQL